MKIPADFGFVSAKYESGGKGVHAVSSGRGDPGGVSYGKHQLASLTGTMAAFVKSPEGEPFRDALDGNPGSEEFTDAYVEIAESNPDEFEAAQLAFIVRTHYIPVHVSAAEQGFSVDNRGVQEALYSMSVQHGGALKIVKQAKALMWVQVSAEEQIKILYRARAGYVNGLSMPASTKQSILKRYRMEVGDALGAMVITDVFVA